MNPVSATPQQIVLQTAAARRQQWLVPVLLALFFSLWGLRGVDGSSISEDDAPRHALNGAFLLDVTRNHQIEHPAQYGYWYYSRLPALSLPYHPPVFPAFEALIYTLFGVNAFSARIAVAIATFAVVLLLYRLILRTHNEPILAAVVTIAFFGLPKIQKLSATVMLEVPALVFVLAALFFVMPDEDAFQTSRSLMFAVFAAISIWTKQTVFIILFPFIYVVIAWRWRILRKPVFWITIILIAISAVALALLGRQIEWNNMNQSWARMTALQQIVQNSAYYLRWKIIVGLLLLVLALATYWLPDGRKDVRNDRLYICWFISAMLVLMVAPAYSYRYLFFAFPPFLVILFNGMSRTARLMMPNRRWLVPILATCAVLGYGLAYPPVVLRGPAEAAMSLHKGGFRRILYCGTLGNGAFIFAVRSVDPGLDTIVIRGDKLADATFNPDALNSLIQRYGVDSVVLEHTASWEPWDRLSAGSLPFLSLQQVVIMTDSDHYRDGTLSLYRVNTPTHVPESSLKVPISILGRDVDLRF
jgi:hypothetical protein